MRALARTLLCATVLLLWAGNVAADPSRGIPTAGAVAAWSEAHRLMYVAGLVDGMMIENGAYVCTKPRADIITDVMRAFPTMEHRPDFRAENADESMALIAWSVMNGISGCHPRKP